MRSLLACGLLLFSAACLGGSDPVPPTPVILREAPADPAVSRRAADAEDARADYSEELRRVRAEHEALIASIPVTVVPTPTLTAAEVSLVAVARVQRYPDGAPAPPQVGEDWFDPGRGIDFYRDSGDDWTSRRVRESHPHRDLFYFQDYPGSIPNFHDRSIYRHIARELVFEAVDTLPLIGEPTPAMIDLFGKELGWEVRDSPEPVVNLWTTFKVVRDGLLHVYAVGGVMRLGVSSVGEGDTLLEYLTVGVWLGPVVVERLR